MIPKHKSIFGWNELEYVSWGEFRQMAPSIIQLEISRISSLAEASQADTDFYNALIKARYEMRKFANCLAGAEKETLKESCADCLRNAIMIVSTASSAADEKSVKTLQYITDRLNYIYKRIDLIY